MKLVEFASKPDQPGLSSSIRLEVIYVRTPVVFQWHVGTPAAAAATAAAVTELPRVSPGIFPARDAVDEQFQHTLDVHIDIPIR